MIDPRGRSVLTKRMAVPAGGFGELDCPTTVASASGIYSINLYLVRDNDRANLLGQAEAWVKEFQPDRLKIASVVPGKTTAGWIAPEAVRASISLQNLHGSPATDRRVTGRLVLLAGANSVFPTIPAITSMTGCSMAGRNRSNRKWNCPMPGRTKPGQPYSICRSSVLRRRPMPSRFTPRDSRRTTAAVLPARNHVLVSPLPFVIGYKSDGDLEYVTRGTPRAVNVIALDAKLAKIGAGGPDLPRSSKKTYISVLTKQDSGSLCLRIHRTRAGGERGESAMCLPKGLTWSLPTAEPGNFVLEVLDDKNRKLSVVSFAVIGAGDAARSLEKDAGARSEAAAEGVQGG